MAEHTPDGDSLRRRQEFEMEQMRERGKNRWAATSRSDTSKGRSPLLLTIAALSAVTLIVTLLINPLKSGMILPSLQAARGYNIILNSGFEESDGREGAAYWLPFTHAAAEDAFATIYRDTSIGNTGEASLRISSGSFASGAEAGLVNHFSSVPLSGYVTVEGWVKTARTDGRAFLRLVFLDSLGQEIDAPIESRSLSGSRDWTRLRVSSPVPEGAAGGYVGVVVSGQGTAWFDNIRVVADEIWEPENNPRPNSRPGQFHNGDFDMTSLSHYPDGWKMPTGNQTARGILDTEESWIGKNSIRIDAITAQNEPLVWSQICKIEPEKGRSIKLSAYIRKQNAGWSQVAVRILDDSMRTLAFHLPETEDLPRTCDWTRVTISFDLPSSGAYLIIEALSSGPGQVWFDGFSLTQNP